MYQGSHNSFQPWSTYLKGADFPCNLAENVNPLPSCEGVAAAAAAGSEGTTVEGAQEETANGAPASEAESAANGAPAAESGSAGEEGEGAVVEENDGQAEGGGSTSACPCSGTENFTCTIGIGCNLRDNFYPTYAALAGNTRIAHLNPSSTNYPVCERKETEAN